MMAGKRGPRDKIRTLERKLGFFSERGLSRTPRANLTAGVLRMVDEIDKIKQNYYHLSVDGLSSSQSFDDECRALFLELSHLWSEPRGEQKPHIDPECYPRPLYFHEPKDRQFLEEHFRQLLIEKCITYQRNQAAKPRRERVLAEARQVKYGDKSPGADAVISTQDAQAPRERVPSPRVSSPEDFDELYDSDTVYPSHRKDGEQNGTPGAPTAANGPPYGADRRKDSPGIKRQHDEEEDDSQRAKKKQRHEDNVSDGSEHSHPSSAGENDISELLQRSGVAVSALGEDTSPEELMVRRLNSWRPAEQEPRVPAVRQNLIVRLKVTPARLARQIPGLLAGDFLNTMQMDIQAPSYGIEEDENETESPRQQSATQTEAPLAPQQVPQDVTDTFAGATAQEEPDESDADPNATASKSPPREELQIKAEDSNTSNSHREQHPAQPEDQATRPPDGIPDRSRYAEPQYPPWSPNKSSSYESVLGGRANPQQYPPFSASHAWKESNADGHVRRLEANNVVSTAPQRISTAYNGPAAPSSHLGIAGRSYQTPPAADSYGRVPAAAHQIQSVATDVAPGSRRSIETMISSPRQIGSTVDRVTPSAIDHGHHVDANRGFVSRLQSHVAPEPWPRSAQRQEVFNRERTTSGSMAPPGATDFTTIHRSGSGLFAADRNPATMASTPPATAASLPSTPIASNLQVAVPSAATSSVPSESLADSKATTPATSAPEDFKAPPTPLGANTNTNKLILVDWKQRDNDTAVICRLTRYQSKLWQAVKSDMPAAFAGKRLGGMSRELVTMSAADVFDKYGQVIESEMMEECIESLMDEALGDEAGVERSWQKVTVMMKD